jgi:WXG100 family type VII secretion target
MSRYEVDSDQVAAASGKILASAQQIQTEVDGMMRQLLDLQSTWKGTASTQFQHVVADWRTTQERVRSSLEEIHQALSTAGQNYSSAEDAATRMFAR